MYKVNFFIVLISLSFLFAQCEDSQIIEQEQEEVEDIKIKSVEYVNKYISPDRLEGTSTGYNAIDLAMNVNQVITSSDVKRIYLYADDKAQGIGWELNNEEINVTDSLIQIPNLVLYNTLRDDSKFEIVLELNDDRFANYTFIHKGLFPSIPTISSSWHTHNTLYVSITYSAYNQQIFEPDTVIIYWLNNNNVIDSTLNQYTNTIALTDLPTTADSYFVKLKGSISRVNQVLFSDNYPLPDKLPDNLNILDDLYLTNSNYYRNNDFFVQFDNMLAIMSTNDYESFLYIYDVINDEMVNKINFDENIQSLARTDSSLYIGFPSGLIKEYDINNKTIRNIFQNEASVNGLININNWLLISTEIGYDEQVLSLNLESDTLKIEQSNYFASYDPYNFIWSEVHQVGFSDKGGISPQDLMTFTLNMDSGEIGNVRDSRYHGDFPIQGPFYFLENESEILTSSGTVFNLDMEYIGRYQNVTNFPVIFNEEDYLFALRSNTNVIDKYNLTDRTIINTTSINGLPKYIFSFDNKIYALVTFGTNNERSGILEFDLSDLETVPTKNKMLRVNYPTNF